MRKLIDPTASAAWLAVGTRGAAVAVGGCSANRRSTSAGRCWNSWRQRRPRGRRGDDQPVAVSVRGRITYRGIRTGYLVAELRYSDSLTAAMLPLDPDVHTFENALAVEHILQNSVTAGRATWPVTGFDHLMQTVDLQFTAPLPAAMSGAASDSLATRGLFLVLYMGDGEKLELPTGQDSLLVTPFDVEAVAGAVLRLSAARGAADRGPGAMTARLPDDGAALWAAWPARPTPDRRLDDLGGRRADGRRSGTGRGPGGLPLGHAPGAQWGARRWSAADRFAWRAVAPGAPARRRARACRRRPSTPRVALSTVARMVGLVRVASPLGCELWLGGQAGRLRMRLGAGRAGRRRPARAGDGRLPGHRRVEPRRGGANAAAAWAAAWSRPCRPSGRLSRWIRRIGAATTIVTGRDRFTNWSARLQLAWRGRCSRPRDTGRKEQEMGAGSARIAGGHARLVAVAAGVAMSAAGAAAPRLRTAQLGESVGHAGTERALRADRAQRQAAARHHQHRRAPDPATATRWSACSPAIPRSRSSPRATTGTTCGCRRTDTGWIHASLCEEFGDMSDLEFRPNPRLFSRVGSFSFTRLQRRLRLRSANPTRSCSARGSATTCSSSSASRAPSAGRTWSARPRSSNRCSTSRSRKRTSTCCSTR